MISKSSEPDDCRSATRWLALACFAPFVLLGGCCGFNRCEIWDRVTHPDYMHQEHTRLHGYHRTSWDSWPEEWNHLGWSQRVHAKSKDDPREQEELPSADSSQELPLPETEESAPDATDESSSPQARTRKSRSSKATPRRLNRSQESAAKRSLAGIDVEARATEVSVASPLMLDAAPAPWTDRFTSLISSDRKARWRELKPAPAEEPSVDRAPVEEAAPLMAASHETPTPATIEQEPVTESPTHATEHSAPAGEGELSPIQTGKGDVQFRIAPASDAGPVPDDAAAKDEPLGPSRE